MLSRKAFLYTEKLELKLFMHNDIIGEVGYGEKYR